ncbi:MAG: histidine phosphatase family protein [Parachlamydiaceae bacterium]|nr:histidine phosphatase family protein [Parachlamydiaceae bacterium]
MNTNIYIVKGGETALTGQVWHGADTISSLTVQGEKSAATLQSRVFSWGISVAYTSPQKRIIDSAEIVLKDINIIATVTEDLGPRKITPFEGMAGEDVKALYRQHNGLDPECKITSDAVFSKEWGPWESGAFEINDRLRTRIKHFIDMVLDSHPRQNVFVQTHVDWIREAYRLFTGAPETEDYVVNTKTVLNLTFNDNKELITVEREEMPNR